MYEGRPPGWQESVSVYYTPFKVKVRIKKINPLDIGLPLNTRYEFWFKPNDNKIYIKHDRETVR